MTYSIMLLVKVKGQQEAHWVYDAILPGLIPDRIFDLMEARFVEEELDLCKLCDVEGARCHVIQEDPEHRGRKLCPILFHDAVQPAWRVEDIV